MSCTHRIFITGATGFLGHYILSALLRHGKRCVAMVRPGREERLRALLGELGAAATNDQLTVLEGQLPNDLPRCVPEGIRAIVHIAGVTRFRRDANGEPARTNVDGTRALLNWAAENRIGTFHHLSTAYVCGKDTGTIPEQRVEKRPDFHNAYEESKWEAERLCIEWAQAENRSLTIFRPSVVVGDRSTGRATQFRGFYLLPRAMEMLARAVAENDPAKRHAIRLGIPGQADGRIDLVPVDFVADAVAHIVSSPDHHDGIYHLTHPNPPCNEQIKQWLESYFDIGGGRFIGENSADTDNADDSERIFRDAIRSAAPYMIDSPRFELLRATDALRASTIQCPDFDETSIRRLIRYAQQARWGRTGSARKSAGQNGPGQNGHCARYFERFLPEYVGRSQVAAKTAVSATIQFVITDVPAGQWTCRFDHGHLVEVHRGSNGHAAEFGYRANTKVFWDSISGRVQPEVLFFDDSVELYGDIERALKMASILHEFTKEFPCDRKRLQNYPIPTRTQVSSTNG